MPKNPIGRADNRKLETYARTLLEAASSDNQVVEDLADLKENASGSPAILSLLSKMAKEGDLDLLPQVMRRYRRMVETSLKVVGVNVTTAIPLDDELRDLITEKCEGDFGCKVLLIERVDPSIVGGLVISVNNKTWDASVRHQLDEAREVLTHSLKTEV